RRRTKTAKKVIARNFIPVSENQGFQYVYLHCRGKEPISSMRSKLRKLGLQSGRILDVHFPANQVVALLVHNDYVNDVEDLLNRQKITLLADFNPLSGDILKDPK
ncbi:hypothetical protein BDB01DRAFT_700219, partial [Pilobolus umbonatus]